MPRSLARRVVSVVAAVALLVGASGCPRGSENLVPRTRKGWGVVFILLGGAWVVTGGVVAADDENTTGQRIGGGLAFGALGVALIGLGWTLGDFGDQPAQPAQVSPTAGAPPPPPPPPPGG